MGEDRLEYIIEEFQKQTEAKFKNVINKQEELEKRVGQVERDNAASKEQINTLFRFIDEIKADIKTIMGSLGDLITTTKIIQEPLSRWEKIKVSVISGVTVGILTFIFTALIMTIGMAGG